MALRESKQKQIVTPGRSSFAKQGEETPECYTFWRMYDCLSGEPVGLSETEGYADIEGQVDTAVSSKLRTLNEYGTVIVRGVADFAGKTIPPDLLSQAMVGIAQAIESLIPQKTLEKWQPTTDEFGYMQLEFLYQHVSITNMSAETVSNIQPVMPLGFLGTGASDDAEKPEPHTEGVESDLGEIVVATTDKDRLTDDVLEVDPYGQGGPVPSLDEKIKELTAGLPDGYDERAAELAAINAAVRRQLAAELAPALNAKIQAMPHETLEQKKELARWVNDELEPLGLAVQCPNTGLPAKLKASTGHWPGVGRFHFEVYINGQRKHPAFSDTLPELKLIDATPPKEPEVTWQQAVGRKSSQSVPRR